MKTVTRSQLIAFILAQNPSRPVNMSQPRSKDKCGCVMVHYGKEKLNLKNFQCGFETWIREGEVYDPCVRLACNIEELVGSVYNSKAKTYGDLQKLIQPLAPTGYAAMVHGFEKRNKQKFFTAIANGKRYNAKNLSLCENQKCATFEDRNNNFSPVTVSLENLTII